MSNSTVRKHLALKVGGTLPTRTARFRPKLSRVESVRFTRASRLYGKRTDGSGPKLDGCKDESCWFISTNPVLENTQLGPGTYDFEFTYAKNPDRNYTLRFVVEDDEKTPSGEAVGDGTSE